jgi:ankyrin repeat protein
VSKNINKNEWKFIVARLQEREAQNKSTDFRVRGMLVPRSKIQKQRRLYEPHSIFDRLSSRRSTAIVFFLTEGGTFADLITEFGAVQRPPTPTSIVVSTPIASPSSFSDLVAFDAVSMGVSSAFCLTSDMPWAQFHNLMSSLTFPRWSLGEQPRSLSTTVHTRKLQIETLLGSSNGLPQSQDTGHIHKPTTSGFSASTVLGTPAPYLPMVMPGSPSSGNHGIVGLSNGMTESDLMRLLVGTTSNNFETHETTTLVMELIEDQKYNVLLKNLLAQKLDTVSAFAEKLLIPAAHLGKWDLVEALVESGVDVDMCSDTGHITHSVTALQCAVEQVNINMIRYLIKRGAAVFTAIFRSRFNRAWETVKGTILDLAIDGGHLNLVSHLLQNANLDPGRLPRVTIYHLRNAILLGHVDLARLLLDNYSGLCEAARRAPWLFYEAAAVCEDKNHASKCVDMLLSHNFNIAATDASGHGSILAAASVVPNVTMIRKLLDAGFSSSCVAVGHIKHCGTFSDGSEIYASTLRAIKRKSALHVAIDRRHEDLVKLLLSHGADANQICGLYPIQRAVRRSPTTIVNLLVKAGADVNASQYYSGLPKAINYTDNSLPAIMLALQLGYIETAELLHGAGATIHDDIAKSFDWEDTLRCLINGGSQNLVLSLTPRLLPQKKLSTGYCEILVGRFGIDFMDHLTDIGIIVIRIPGIYAIIARGLRLNDYDEDFSSDSDTDASNSDNVTNPDDLVLLEQRVMDYVEREDGLSFEHGVRALIMAVRKDLECVVSVLLQAGFDPFAIIRNTGDQMISEVDRQYSFREGDSAFCQSIQYGRRSITRTFLNWNSGWSSEIQHALRRQQICKAYILAHRDNDDIVWVRELFSDYGFGYEEVKHVLGQDYVRKCFYGLLYEAMTYGVNESDIEWILQYHNTCGDLVNPPARDLGNTPLQLLAEQDKSQYIRKLLDLGADVNARADDFRGATALQFASIKGNFEAVDILIKAGADINALPAAYDGRTAVEGAAEWGRLDMVHYLLEAGADIQLRTNYRRTVYRAWKNGHRTVARMVHRWKSEKYGEGTCESLQSVMESMTQFELDGDIWAVEDMDELEDVEDSNPLLAYIQLRHERKYALQECQENQRKARTEYNMSLEGHRERPVACCS